MIKNDFDDSGVRVDYVEEVDENQLYNKKNQNDIIYVESFQSKTKNVVLLILSIIFILASLFAVIFGFVYFNKQIDEGQKYTLFVTHSNEYYGANSVLLGIYNSSENTYDYNFNVGNTNDVELNYKIQIENINFGSDNIDYSSINYSLFNHDTVVSNGTLINDKTIDLVDMNIAANANQQFVLKIWSNNIDKEFKYSFKVNVLV